MMGNIVLLDEHTINKIAAGEVVDRPASIVKELVENSIDAGASAVTIEIKNGGIKYIRITDNGKGFPTDDVEMAFERHATSKIRTEEDLLKITSMGFRGEALASIAAISKVSLLTKTKEENVGTEAKVEGGKIIDISPAASVVGSRIEIRDVFYNVPARFKFLKKDYTEAGYIEDVVTRIALSHPTISFKYINNGKTIIQTSGNGDLKTTIYDIFGKEVYENVIPVDYEHNGIHLTGMIGLPKISRSTRMHQFTFINTRYIKDKTINTAIDKAFSEKLAINKFGFAVINIDMDPSHIDVNVHPAKLEVKFEDENAVFECIYYGILSAIENHNRDTSPFTTIKKMEETQDIDQISKDLKMQGIIQSHSGPTNKYTFDVAEQKTDSYITNERKEKVETTPVVQSVQSPTVIEKAEVAPVENTSVESGEEIGVSAAETVVEKGDNLKDKQQTIYIDEENTTTIETNPKQEILYQYVGQVFDTYIIIQIREKMYIIDQHAAHERLLYEQIKEAYYAKEKQSQLLLIPILVELTTKEKLLVEQNMDMFEASGFMIEDFGDNAIKISGVPNIGYDIDYKSMLKDIIDELLGATKTEKQEKEFRFIATLACKAAVKGNMRLTVEEQKALISEMVKLENPFTCPHGRPTAYEITKYEIERRFLRK